MVESPVPDRRRLRTAAIVLGVLAVVLGAAFAITTLQHPADDHNDAGRALQQIQIQIELGRQNILLPDPA